MLEGYGLHQLTWDTCDERFGGVLVASPADAGGRGISLTVRQNGAAANLTGATVYFVWCHKVTGERGTEPFSAVDASAGTFEVYYPAACRRPKAPCRRRSWSRVVTAPTSALVCSPSAWSQLSSAERNIRTASRCSWTPSTPTSIRPRSRPMRPTLRTLRWFWLTRRGRT